MKDWDWTSDSDWGTYEHTPSPCRHEWKGTWLIITQVWDCIKCGAKKEEVENEKRG